MSKSPNKNSLSNIIALEIVGEGIYTKYLDKEWVDLYNERHKDIEKLPFEEYCFKEYIEYRTTNITSFYLSLLKDTITKSIWLKKSVGKPIQNQSLSQIIDKIANILVFDRFQENAYITSVAYMNGHYEILSNETKINALQQKLKESDIEIWDSLNFSDLFKNGEFVFLEELGFDPIKELQFSIDDIILNNNEYRAIYDILQFFKLTDHNVTYGLYGDEPKISPKNRQSDRASIYRSKI